MRRLFTCHQGLESELHKEQKSTVQVSVAAEVFQKFFRQQERCSSRYHMHTQYSIDTCNSNTEYGQSSSVSSLPKRKVMAFSSWTLCVLKPHLRVSILYHFSRVLCPIKKREHPVSITPFPM